MRMDHRGREAIRDAERLLAEAGASWTIQPTHDHIMVKITTAQGRRAIVVLSCSGDPRALHNMRASIRRALR